MKSKSSEFFNIPNTLCYIRILLIPVFAVLYLSGQTHWAAMVVVLSGLTDFADGFIARKFNMITDWGKLIDPIADKLTQAAIAVCLISRIQWMYILFIILLIKEIFMGVIFLVMFSKGKTLDGAKWFGKISTTVFYITMFLLIAVPFHNVMLTTALVIIAGVFLLMSFVMYIHAFIQLNKS